MRKLDIENIKTNIQNVISHIKTINPDSKIVLFWMKLPLNFWINYSNNFSITYKDLAEKNDIYFYEFFLEWVARDSKLNLNDWIHPNAIWYKIISNNIFKYLKKLNIITK